MLKRWSERGDTIIEVLLAVTVFSLVAVGGITIMNQGTNTAQRAVEITLVRQQIDAQTEALRAVHQAEARSEDNNPTSTWNSITGPTATSYSGESCPADQASLPSGAFALNPAKAEVLNGTTWFNQYSPITDPPYAKVNATTSYGIWIERTADVTTTPSSTDAPGVYTFRIRACWEGAGLSTPMRLETVVRLYEI